jgi:hypothetical protein
VGKIKGSRNYTLKLQHYNASDFKFPSSGSLHLLIEIGRRIDQQHQNCAQQRRLIDQEVKDNSNSKRNEYRFQKE